MRDEIELLVKIYEDQAAQCRHHESQRTNAVNLILVVAAAVLGLSGLSGVSPAFVPAASFLIVLGLFGALFARKHYERFKYHSMQAGKYWESIELLEPKTVVRLESARKDHNAKFKVIRSVPLNWFWTGSPLLVSLIGVCCCCKSSAAAERRPGSRRPFAHALGFSRHELPQGEAA